MQVWGKHRSKEVLAASLAIITVVETWVDQNILGSEVAIQGYKMFRRDRLRHGGGTYISYSIKSSLC